MLKQQHIVALHILVYSIMLLTCFHLYHISSIQCLSFNCYSADIGIFSQYMWKLANFQPLDSSVRLVNNILLDHQHFSMVLLVPFYWIFRIFNESPLDFLNFVNPLLLVFLPTIIIGRIVQTITGEPAPILFKIASFIFLALHPYTQNALWSGFHEISLLSTLLPLLVWLNIAIVRSVIDQTGKSLKLFIGYLVAFLLCLGVKETALIILTPIAIQLFILNIGCIWFFHKRVKELLIVPVILLFLAGALIMGYYMVLQHIWVYREIQYNLQFNSGWNEIKQYHLIGYSIIDLPSMLVGNLAGIVDMGFRYTNQFSESPNWHHGTTAPILTLLTVASFNLLNAKARGAIIFLLLFPNLLVVNFLHAQFSSPNRSGYFQMATYNALSDTKQAETLSFREIEKVVASKRLEGIMTSYTLLPMLAGRNHIYFETGNNPGVYSVGINTTYKPQVQYLLFPKPGASSCFAAFYWHSNCKEFSQFQSGKELIFENQYFKLTHA